MAHVLFIVMTLQGITSLLNYFVNFGGGACCLSFRIDLCDAKKKSLLTKNHNTLNKYQADNEDQILQHKTL